MANTKSYISKWHNLLSRLHAATNALAAVLLSLAVTAGSADARPAAAARAWPEGTQLLPAEDLDGILLVHGTLRGANGRDTTGDLVVDTGAGYLALDRQVAFALGLTDTLVAPGALELAPHPLSRLTLADAQLDQIAPVLTVDADVVRRVTDRGVLGLLGERPLAPFIVCLDYQSGIMALVPAGAARAGESALAASRRQVPGLSAHARAVAFRLAGDGKLLVRARVEEADGRARSGALTLVLDTGASKTVFFDPAFSRAAPHAARWPALRGLTAPTLLGSTAARVIRVPRMSLEASSGAARVTDMDAAVMEGELSEVLSRAIGEPIHGLLGYSYLRHHRVAIDFARRLVWLDPVAVGRDARPNEYSHIGIQVERVEGAMRVVAVAEGTPAEEAGIAADDEVESLDGEDARAMEVIDFLRRLEGPPGSTVTLVVKRGESRRTLSLVRRRLL